MGECVSPGGSLKGPTGLIPLLEACLRMQRSGREGLARGGFPFATSGSSSFLMAAWAGPVSNGFGPKLMAKAGRNQNWRRETVTTVLVAGLNNRGLLTSNTEYCVDMDRVMDRVMDFGEKGKRV